MKYLTPWLPWTVVYWGCFVPFFYFFFLLSPCHLFYFFLLQTCQDGVTDSIRRNVVALGAVGIAFGAVQVYMRDSFIVIY